MLNTCTNTSLIPRVSLLPGKELDSKLQHKAEIIWIQMTCLDHRLHGKEKEENENLENFIYMYHKVNQWIQCLALQIPQHNASHLTGTLITVPQEQGKLEIDSFKQHICSKVTNQCLIARIPQRKASHLTDIYLYHSTA